MTRRRFVLPSQAVREGASEGDYASLNLGTHVGDDRDVVLGNRRALLCAFGGPDMPLVVPNQVHGTDLVDIETSDPEALRGIQDAADAGADELRCFLPSRRCAPLLRRLRSRDHRIADGACGGGPRGLARSRGAYRLFSLQAPRRPRCAREPGMMPRFLPSSTPISDRISAHRASRRGRCGTTLRKRDRARLRARCAPCRFGRGAHPRFRIGGPFARADCVCARLHEVRARQVLLVSCVGRRMRSPWCTRFPFKVRSLWQWE